MSRAGLRAGSPEGWVARSRGPFSWGCIFRPRVQAWMDELHPIYLGCESRNERARLLRAGPCHLKPHYLPPLRLGIVFTLRALSTWSASALSASHRCTYAENEVAQPSARRAPSRLHRRQRMPEAAPRCGQPRPPTSAALGRFTAGMATLGLGSRRSAAPALCAPAAPRRARRRSFRRRGPNG